MLSTILVGAICGGIAGGFAALVIPNRAENRVAYLVVTIVVFACLNFGARTFLLPELRVWQVTQGADAAIASNKTLSLLVSEHPELRDEFVKVLQDVARRGAGEEEARHAGGEWGRTVLSKYFGEYGPKASAESLTSFTAALVDQLDKLAGRSDAACVYLLFGGEPPADFKMENEVQISDAMGAVIESAIRSPETPVTASDAKRGMDALFVHLQAAYGPEFLPRLAAFGPGGSRSNDHVLCDTARKFYHGALELSPEERPLAIRAIFKGAAKQTAS
ncbi:MAG TPA: hypothetical protein VMR50_07260 [Myxococcota bacterium]|nr:hypothetical protein [Myxococcota bacterium]